MAKYRKKPVVIEAIQFDGNNHREISEFLGWGIPAQDGVCSGFPIETLEGTMIARAGDYIIRGVNGEFYPCKPDIFAQTYEEV